jgi:asparagine synthase (glutamine-hydrolysing)
MCGIAGVLYADPNRPAAREALRAMGRSIAHRGPDAEGILCEPGLGLVHRRLSIIDLSGGGQPLGNEDGSIQVVFNGEIYNFQSLRDQLQRRGHQFRTRSDTEVLVHLYEEEGEELVGRLRGMFAFALWDRRRRLLLLARDRVGIKPLYIYRDADKLVFGSELKAILAHPGVPRRVDECAIEEYLTFGMVPGERAVLRGMEKLPPAHVLTVRPDLLQAAPRRYWQLQVRAEEGRAPEECIEEVRAKVQECVRMHLIADVPLGAFLSGGIDSSIMVAASASQVATPLRTFSIGFSEEAFSELPAARTTAERFGTRHTEEVVRADALQLLDKITHHYDEPFADPSAIPTYIVSGLAARHVKVVLSGDGGDEAFGGYERYRHDLREAAVRRQLPGWLRAGLLRPLAQLWPKTDWLPRPLRAKTTLTNLSLAPADAYANTLSLCRRPLRKRLLRPELAAAAHGCAPEERVKRLFQMADPGDCLAGMLTTDTSLHLPDDFLVKVDRASMGHGLEVRPPLLDHELLEVAARLPSSVKVRDGKGKWVLREAFRPLLPPAILERPKQGFDIPIDDWMRGPLRERIEGSVLSKSAPVAELIDPACAAKLYRAHQARRARYGGVLWSLLVLAGWAERYLAERPEEAGA